MDRRMEPHAQGLKVLVPSRGRPDNIRRLIDSWGPGGDTHHELVVGIDYGDETATEYFRVRKEHSFVIHIGANDQRGMARVLNTLAASHCWNSEVVGFMGDDHVPRTQDWQARVLDWCRAHPFTVMYGDDTIHGRNLPTAVFMDAKIVRMLGYMVPPDAHHLFLDNFWKFLGESLGTLHFDPQLVIEHMHPIAGKAEWDPGYREVNTSAMWDHDKQVFDDWCDQADSCLAPLRVAIRA